MGKRNGFTLVELLVVIAIISLLLAIAGGTLSYSLSLAKEAKTRATIVKVDDSLQHREIELRRFITKAKRGGPFSESGREYFVLFNQAKAAYSLSNDATHILVLKGLSRQTFPQLFSDSPTLIAGKPFDASKHLPETESAECLYLIHDGDFLASEIADTDGDGLMEVVDAWGRPLQFYRWPTKVNLNPDVQKFLFPSQFITTTGVYDVDPDDNDNLMSAATNFSTTYHDLKAWHQFVIMSSGADEELGLFHAADTANNGHLGAIQNAAAITDNITNAVRP